MFFAINLDENVITETLPARRSPPFCLGNSELSLIALQFVFRLIKLLKLRLV